LTNLRYQHASKKQECGLNAAASTSACSLATTSYSTAGLPATTAEGAAAALDHVLNDESLWHGSEEYAGEAFLRQLIEAARDYIMRTAVSRRERGF
jgi:hypothetical protein